MSLFAELLFSSSRELELLSRPGSGRKVRKTKMSRKPFAEFAREANTGKLCAEMVYRYGVEIPERLRGVRPIVKANNYRIVFMNADGKESDCIIRRASCCHYDGITLKVDSHNTPSALIYTIFRKDGL